VTKLNRRSVGDVLHSRDLAPGDYLWIAYAICSSYKHSVDDEWTLPPWGEFILLLRKAKDELPYIVSLCLNLPALIAPSLLLIYSRMSPGNAPFLLQSVQSVLPIDLGLSFLIHTHSRCIMYNIAQENSFGTVYHKKWGISRGTVWGST
jgi:hypothetical protein